MYVKSMIAEPQVLWGTAPRGHFQLETGDSFVEEWQMTWVVP